MLQGEDLDREAFYRAFPSVAVDVHPPDTLFTYDQNWAVSIYSMLRPFVYSLAVLSALYCLYLKSWLAAAPMLVQTANVLVYAELGLVYGRYIESLDALLLAQVAIGWALAWYSARSTMLTGWRKVRRPYSPPSAAEAKELAARAP
jgi:hypothetical protein